MNAGLPVLCFPHFGDQATDAMNLIEARAALSLIAPSLADSRDDDPRYFQFEQPMFSAEDVCDKFHSLLSNPTYKLGAMRLKCQALAAGGG